MTPEIPANQPLLDIRLNCDLPPAPAVSMPQNEPITTPSITEPLFNPEPVSPMTVSPTFERTNYVETYNPAENLQAVQPENEINSIKSDDSLASILLLLFNKHKAIVLYFKAHYKNYLVLVIAWEVFLRRTMSSSFRER